MGINQKDACETVSGEASDKALLAIPGSGDASKNEIPSK
jgi:hypothetical protein